MTPRKRRRKGIQLRAEDAAPAGEAAHTAGGVPPEEAAPPEESAPIPEESAPTPEETASPAVTTVASRATDQPETQPADAVEPEPEPADAMEPAPADAVEPEPEPASAVEPQIEEPEPERAEPESTEPEPERPEPESAEPEPEEPEPDGPAVVLEPRETPETDARGAGATDAETTPGPVKDPRGAWRRLLLAGSPRATRANVLALLLAGTLGFAIIAQVRQTSIQGLENLREDELVRIFAGVDLDGDRLGDEIQGLESSLQLLQSQSTNDAEAQRAAKERLDALGILAGTAAARGPGIVLTVRDPDLQVTSPVILDAVQELRDAGAEAIQIGDQRVVASTWFAQTDAGISVSGTELRPPYVIRAIGDGSTLAGAMEIPGGVNATVRRAGGETDVQIRDEVEVDSLLSLSPPQYARPVPTSTP